MKAYEKSVEVSGGHPYPLLVAIKLRVHLSGKFELAPETYMQLGRAEGLRKAQVQHDPTIDVPWPFFDLAEILLYQKKTEQALKVAREEFKRSNASCMPSAFITAIEMLPQDADIPGLDEVLERAREEGGIGSGGELMFAVEGGCPRGSLNLGLGPRATPCAGDNVDWGDQPSSLVGCSALVDRLRSPLACRYANSADL